MLGTAFSPAWTLPREVSSPRGRGQPAAWGWRPSCDVPPVALRSPAGAVPVGGTSGRVSALLADNHDIISLKLYQLTVERTPEEEKRDREVYLPVVDNLKLPGSK